MSYEPIKYKYDNVQVVADEGQLFMAVPGPLHNKLVRMHTTWSYVMRISANRVDHLQSECIEKAEKHAKFRSLMIPEGEVRDEHVGYWPATTHFLVMYACIQEGIPMNHAVLLRVVDSDNRDHMYRVLHFGYQTHCFADDTKRMPPPILASDALRKCGNPSCAKPGNVKDATLARCSACRVIAYCSGECQQGLSECPVSVHSPGNLTRGLSGQRTRRCLNIFAVAAACSDKGPSGSCEAACSQLQTFPGPPGELQRCTSDRASSHQARSS